MKIKAQRRDQQSSDPGYSVGNVPSERTFSTLMIQNDSPELEIKVNFAGIYAFS